MLARILISCSYRSFKFCAVHVNFQATKSNQPARSPFKDAHGRDSESHTARAAASSSKTSNDAASVRARPSQFYGTPTKKLNAEKTKTVDLKKISEISAGSSTSKDKKAGVM